MKPTDLLLLAIAALFAPGCSCLSCILDLNTVLIIDATRNRMDLECNGTEVLVNFENGEIRDTYIDDNPIEKPTFMNNTLQLPPEKPLDKCWLKMVSYDGDETDPIFCANQNTSAVIDETTASQPPEPQTTPLTITVPSNIITSRMTPAPDSPKAEGQSEPAPWWIVCLYAAAAFLGVVAPVFLISYLIFKCYKRCSGQRLNNIEPRGEPNADQDIQAVQNGHVRARAQPVSIPFHNNGCGPHYSHVLAQDNETAHRLSLQNTQESTYMETNIDAHFLENRNGGDDAGSVSTPVCDSESTQFHMSMAGQDDGPESDCLLHAVGQASTRSALDTETPVIRNGHLDDADGSTPLLDRGGDTALCIEMQHMTASYKPQKRSPVQC